MPGTRASTASKRSHPWRTQCVPLPQLSQPPSVLGTHSHLFYKLLASALPLLPPQPPPTWPKASATRPLPSDSGFLPVFLSWAATPQVPIRVWRPQRCSTPDAELGSLCKSYGSREPMRLWFAAAAWSMSLGARMATGFSLRSRCTAQTPSCGRVRRAWLWHALVRQLLSSATRSSSWAERASWTRCTAASGFPGLPVRDGSQLRISSNVVRTPLLLFLGAISS
mmetsp:Transcript_14842/g.33694  ORF Transcript_14842/g.33694 Transcript_14842/m.33694 type:complete len:224 (-) Transcript_14842:402-1073(-)